jgi:hypothetical protein
MSSSLIKPELDISNILKMPLTPKIMFYSTNGQLPTKQDTTDNLAMKQAIKQLQCMCRPISKKFVNR